jgi:hypothetical protein
MTNTVVAWLPVFAHSPFVEFLLDSWRFLQRERGIKELCFADGGHRKLEQEMHLHLANVRVTSDSGTWRFPEIPSQPHIAIRRCVVFVALSRDGSWGSIDMR